MINLFSYQITISLTMSLLAIGTSHPSDGVTPTLLVRRPDSSLSTVIQADRRRKLPSKKKTRESTRVTDQRTSLENQLPVKGPLKLPSSWKGLIPLHVTREEVERVLGQPKISVGSRRIYENDIERVDVVYSTGRCEAVAGRWNVPSGVVILLSIYPKNNLLLEDVIFEKPNYVRHRWSHPEDWVTYRNEEDGIEIDVVIYGENAEVVRQFSFGPKASDRGLQCNNEGAPLLK